MTDEEPKVSEVQFVPLPLAAEVKISEDSPLVRDPPPRNEFKGKIICVFIILVSCLIGLWAFAAIVIDNYAEYKSGFFVTVSKQGDCPNCILVTDVLFYEMEEDDMNNSTQTFWRCGSWDDSNERPMVVSVNLPGFYNKRQKSCTTTEPPSTKRSVTIVGFISAGFCLLAIISIISIIAKSK
jgi:hypothetical protein